MTNPYVEQKYILPEKTHMRSNDFSVVVYGLLKHQRFAQLTGFFFLLFIIFTITTKRDLFLVIQFKSLSSIYTNFLIVYF